MVFEQVVVEFIVIVVEYGVVMVVGFDVVKFVFDCDF